MPKGRHTRTNSSLFQAAILGYEQMKREAEEKIAEIRRMLGFGENTGTQGGTGKPRRTLSAAARRKIATAQKKRWALVKANEAKPKRVLSTEVRKRIAAAQRKRWALTKAKAAAITAQTKPPKKTAPRVETQAQGA